MSSRKTAVYGYDCEKGGKRHAMPCNHNLEEYLTAYLDGAGLRDDPKGPLFRTIGRGTGKLTRTVLPQANAYAMIRRSAAAAASTPSLTITVSAQRGSRRTSKTAARSRRPLHGELCLDADNPTL